MPKTPSITEPPFDYTINGTTYSAKLSLERLQGGRWWAWLDLDIAWHFEILWSPGFVNPKLIKGGGRGYSHWESAVIAGQVVQHWWDYVVINNPSDKAMIKPHQYEDSSDQVTPHIRKAHVKNFGVRCGNKRVMCPAAYVNGHLEQDKKIWLVNTRNVIGLNEKAKHNAEDMRIPFGESFGGVLDVATVPWRSTLLAATPF